MGDFVGPDGDADVAVIIVTYNSADDILGLLQTLRPEAADQRMRVIVVDNASTDGTLGVVQAQGDVIAVVAGGNLGYAGGVNVGRALAGAAAARLVLNPDLRVERGAVQTMLSALHARPRIGIVAPRIIDADGNTATSLHNEPTVVRALCDALLGRLWRSRPARMSEWVRDPRAYLAARATDWATGAALLVSAAADASVGEWDERFFLYSEETDFCRRARDAGFEVWFDPAAVVRHRQGGSGSSAELDALLQVNRVRYIRKHAPEAAGMYRAVVLLAAALRSRSNPGMALSAAVLRDGRRWATLPRAVMAGAPA